MRGSYVDLPGMATVSSPWRLQLQDFIFEAGHNGLQLITLLFCYTHTCYIYVIVQYS